MNKKPIAIAAERILVLFLVSTAASGVMLLLNDLIERFTSFYFTEWIFCLYIFLTGAIALFVSWIFLNEKAGVFANLRFLVFYQVISIALFLFLIPVVPIFITIPSSVLEWILVIKLDKAFACHDSFAKNCGDLTGQSLSSMLHEQSWLTSDYVEQMNDSLFKTSILSVVTLLFFLVLFFTNTQISVLSLVFILLHTVLLLLTLILNSIYKNETYYAGLGLSAIFGIRNRLLLISFLFCILCALIALFISSDNALLKPSYFSWLLDFLRMLFGSKEREQAAPPPEQSFSQGMPASPIPPGIMETEANPILEMIMNIIKWAFLAAIAGGLLFFFFGPFFSAKWKDFWKKKKLLTYLRRFLDALKTAIKALFSIQIKKGEAYAQAAAVFKDKISSILEASKKSKEKKKEIDRLTTQFLKLIEWGEERDIAYKKSLAPAEYTALISERYPALGEPCGAAGALFEKALYAKELLSKEEEESFASSVSAVTKTVTE
ncbi:MAG: DUF4129 domain-containing protein [Treponemataceae bacterium]|nr:DUF4129 domain-containing protein [Treponemataceae bacterium]